MGRVFEIALRGREIRNFAGGIFLLGEGNLTKSDFEPSDSMTCVYQRSFKGVQEQWLQLK